MTYCLVLIYAKEGAWRKFKMPTIVMVLGRRLFEFPDEAPDACDVHVSSPRPPAAARQPPDLVGRSGQVSPCTEAIPAGSFGKEALAKRFTVCDVDPNGHHDRLDTDRERLCYFRTGYDSL